MDATTEKTAKRRRRWFRFSLRTLLIVVTALAIPLGWVGWRLGQVRRERATIAWVEEMGGRVYFLSETDKRSWWEESANKWFGERVRVVSLRNTQVNDLSPLAELKKLEKLWLINTQVSDISPLAELKNLKGLSLDNTQVSDLSPLEELKNITFLHLSDMSVSDLSPLAELKNLKVLWLQYIPVSDLSAVAELKNLIEFRLHETRGSYEQMQGLRRALPNCKIRHSIRVEE